MHVEGEVPPQNIVGITVPEEVLETQVADLPLGLVDMGWDYINRRCVQMLADIEQKLGYKADSSRLEELMSQVEALQTSQMKIDEKGRKLTEIAGKMDRFLGGYIGHAYEHHMGKTGVTLRDVLLLHAPESMPVYNSNGFPSTL